MTHFHKLDSYMLCHKVFPYRDKLTCTTKWFLKANNGNAWDATQDKQNSPIIQKQALRTVRLGKSSSQEEQMATFPSS